MFLVAKKSQIIKINIAGFIKKGHMKTKEKIYYRVHKNNPHHLSLRAGIEAFKSNKTEMIVCITLFSIHEPSDISSKSLLGVQSLSPLKEQ